MRKIVEIVKVWSFTEFGRVFFKENKNVIDKRNMENIKRVSMLMCVAYMIFVILGCFYETARVRARLYLLFCATFFGFYIVTLIYENKNKVMSSVYTYIFTAIALIYGIVIGCFFSSDVPVVLFLVFSVCVPILFIVPPLYMGIVVTVLVNIFLCISRELKDTAIYEVDLLNSLGCLCTGFISMYISVANNLRQIDLNAKLREECNDDELTGMNNRRDFNEYIRYLVKTGKNQNLSIIFVDIDDFKEYNDMYGRVYGDKCLIRVAEVLKDFAKRHDFYVARYVSEEFVIIDRKHNIRDLEAIVAEFIELIEMLNIENMSSKYQKVTASVGIANKEVTNAETIRDLINLADDALYQAKFNGKNNYMVAKHNILERKMPVY